MTSRRHSDYQIAPAAELSESFEKLALQQERSTQKQVFFNVSSTSNNIFVNPSPKRVPGQLRDNNNTAASPLQQTQQSTSSVSTEKFDICKLTKRKFVTMDICKLLFS